MHQHPIAVTHTRHRLRLTWHPIPYSVLLVHYIGSDVLFGCSQQPYKQTNENKVPFFLWNEWMDENTASWRGVEGMEWHAKDPTSEESRPFLSVCFAAPNETESEI